jgi:hypothetical protein
VPDGRNLSWGTRLVAVAGVPIAVVYSVACLLYNAPKSPATIRIAGFTNAVIGSYFEQDWQLFGPTPQSSNNLIYLQVRIRAGDKEIETSPVEVESAIDQAPRAFPLNPTKLAAVTLAFNEDMHNYANSDEQVRRLPARLRAQARYQLNVSNRWFFAELQRFFSARASSLYPGSDILALRVSFASQPMVPFSDRYEQPPPGQQPARLATTSWLAYIPGVAG